MQFTLFFLMLFFTSTVKYYRITKIFVKLLNLKNSRFSYSDLVMSRDPIQTCVVVLILVISIRMFF